MAYKTFWQANNEEPAYNRIEAILKVKKEHKKQAEKELLQTSNKILR